MNHSRAEHSAFAVFIKGMFLTIVSIILASGGLTFYLMWIANNQAGRLFQFAEGRLEHLPEFIENLPPIAGDLLKDRRAPDYAKALVVKADFSQSLCGDGLQPVLHVTNTGDEMITLLSVRVSAVDARGNPVAEWTRVVATPLSADGNDWPGPILPGSERRIILSPWFRLSDRLADGLTSLVEVTDVRVWAPELGEPTAESLTASIQSARHHPTPTD